MSALQMICTPFSIPDLLHLIFSYIPVSDVLSLRRTCKLFDKTGAKSIQTRGLHFADLIGIDFILSLVKLIKSNGYDIIINWFANDNTSWIKPKWFKWTSKDKLRLWLMTADGYFEIVPQWQKTHYWNLQENPYCRTLYWKILEFFPKPNWKWFAREWVYIIVPWYKEDEALDKRSLIVHNNVGVLGRENSIRLEPVTNLAVWATQMENGKYLLSRIFREYRLTKTMQQLYSLSRRFIKEWQMYILYARWYFDTEHSCSELCRADREMHFDSWYDIWTCVKLGFTFTLITYPNPKISIDSVKQFVDDDDPMYLWSLLRRKVTEIIYRSQFNVTSKFVAPINKFNMFKDSPTPTVPYTYRRKRRVYELAHLPINKHQKCTF